MRDTLRPDALPASPVAPPARLRVALRAGAAGAARSLLVRLDACDLARYLFLFARIACGSALLLCTLTSLAHPCACCSDCLASCAALLVRCWFLACCFNASQCIGFRCTCQALQLYFFSAAGSLLVVSMLRSVSGFAALVKPCSSISFLLLVPCLFAAAALHSVEFPAIDRPGLYPCSAALPCECIHSSATLNLSFRINNLQNITLHYSRTLQIVLAWFAFLVL